MTFDTLDTDCIVVTSHKLNPDGYFRKRWTTDDGLDVIEMFHRFIYRAHNGEHSIPDGYEIDHMCGVRSCCNIKHLQLLEGSAHAIKTNQERYAPRKLEAERHWRSIQCTGTALAAKFGVSFSIGCKWIRGWKLAA